MFYEYCALRYYIECCLFYCIFSFWCVPFFFWQSVNVMWVSSTPKVEQGAPWKTYSSRPGQLSSLGPFHTTFFHDALPYQSRWSSYHNTRIQTWKGECARLSHRCLRDDKKNQICLILWCVFLTSNQARGRLLQKDFYSDNWRLPLSKILILQLEALMR